MDMVRFVVEHSQLVNFAHDLAEIGLAVGGFAHWLGPERFEEVVA